ncbi:MAG: bifunctional (p)ppGpp synthetase/guanosine-3',5'-bis(diphosphate) 3'-pyrophosphohydrolase [Alphaproteobacteria bacterium]|nr:MAG: bifunctional (p)ppGpp synthetase/guanosine-3',5'-bis(diphosphate) 3'-pyrophosphohydrolase [Alphaproteobacteria bacterium]
MLRQYELVEKVKAYDPRVDEALLNRAYVFTLKAHGTQMRHSGDPYFSHPIEVAGILTDLEMDGDTIITAILHDTIEDTVATKEQIEELFGPNVARMVDGVTKLSRIEIPTEQTRQVESFRKFLLAMSTDIRVLLVKLADRLHNMRTLQYHPTAEARRRIALETLEIYAPLAERIGMYDMKDELSSLAFKYINPEAEASIVKRLEMLRREAGNIVARVVDELGRTLREAGVEAQVTGREKRPYSIWRKMESKHMPFERLSDVVAFRIVVDDMATCYRALGIVHGTWSFVPNRFKDYISTPKANGYQSLHTTVIGPENQRIEIQIRSRAMHEIAEHGVAAHWRYKQGIGQIDGRQYGWVRDLLDVIKDAGSPEELLENTKLAMFQDQVFCFTPKGDLITLPRGATTVDFAYAVHSDIGDTCVGAKVNGRVVPLRTVLENGDQVEILRSSAQRPSPKWESFVITAKARSAIRRSLRQRRREDYIELGRQLLDHAVADEDIKLSKRALKSALGPLSLKSEDDLFEALGRGSLSEDEVLRLIFPTKDRPRARPRLGWRRSKARAKNTAALGRLPIRGLNGSTAMRLADCCHPLPGDRIVGIRAAGQGVLVHTIDCEALEAFGETPERWLDLAWEPDADLDQEVSGRLRLVLHHEQGALATVAQIVAKNDGNITNLRIVERDPHFFTLLMDVGVADVRHLTDILTAIRAARAVTSAERVRG